MTDTNVQLRMGAGGLGGARGGGPGGGSSRGPGYLPARDRAQCKAT